MQTHICHKNLHHTLTCKQNTPFTKKHTYIIPLHANTINHSQKLICILPSHENTQYTTHHKLPTHILSHAKKHTTHHSPQITNTLALACKNTQHTIHKNFYAVLCTPRSIKLHTIYHIHIPIQ